MDPFFGIVQESLRAGKTLEEALTEVTLLLKDSDNQRMLHELAASQTGREILAEWQQGWQHLGIPAPWSGLLSNDSEHDCFQDSTSMLLLCRL